MSDRSGTRHGVLPKAHIPAAWRSTTLPPQDLQVWLNEASVYAALQSARRHRDNDAIVRVWRLPVNHDLRPQKPEVKAITGFIGWRSANRSLDVNKELANGTACIVTRGLGMCGIGARLWSRPMFGLFS